MGAALSGPSSRVAGRAAVEAIEPPRLPTGIDTPALVIDLDIAERNSRQLVETLAARGQSLRPHAKTH
jgi:D-serine deaminase-like pyridoxal phosphate-dependent protein